ncbi:MAG: polyphosphate polymerase domain-containing protein [Lachnospiraceae bacterium]|nr:polyphosphate polymerase domain-containing protein [Lachnospiraceae bacterium]
MIDRNKIYRNEWKYVISYPEAELLKSRLLPFMKLDPHATEDGYEIRSLYFDDYYNSAYVQKLMGVNSRNKWRIRIYNYSDSKIALERKKKTGNYIYKESADITRDEFRMILEDKYDFLLKKEKNLYKEFYYECKCNLLRPKVIVDYVRVPLIMDEGTVRITFDSEVAAAVGGFDIFDASLPKLPAQDPLTLVLEVKYTEFLPQVIKELLPLNGHEFTAFSKYVACYDAAHHLTDPGAGMSKTYMGWRN